MTDVYQVLSSMHIVHVCSHTKLLQNESIFVIVPRFILVGVGSNRCIEVLHARARRNDKAELRC